MSRELSFGSVEKEFARTQAVEQDPSLATPEGRVMREVQITLGRLAVGEVPRTVLGGLIMNGRFDTPAVEGETGRTLPHMSVAGEFGIYTADGVFSTQQILDDLIHVGLVVYDEPPENSPEALLKGDEYLGRPTYLLASPTTLDIERLSPERDLEEARQREERREAMSQPRPRKGLIQRYRERRWVKKMSAELREKYG